MKKNLIQALRRANRTRRTMRNFLLKLWVIRQCRMVMWRRLTPLATRGGATRGTMIARYYFNRWICQHAGDIRGYGAELGGEWYISQFGSCEKYDVIDIDPSFSNCNVVVDLQEAWNISDNTYDCFIVPSTFHIISDWEKALFHALRILKPGGVLLANFPGPTYIPDDDPEEYKLWSVYWYFNPIMVKRSFAQFLPDENVAVSVYGNMYVQFARSMGLCAEELNKNELCFHDERFPVNICVRAVKPLYCPDRAAGV